MASSITLTSSSYGGRYLQLTCTQTKDVTNNRSTISWTLSSVGGEVNYYNTGPTTVTINGKQVYYKARVKWEEKAFPAKKGSVSDTVTIDHNTDGSKTISVSLSTAIYSATVKTYSSDWVLDSIDRGATFDYAPSAFSNTSLPTIYYTNRLGSQVSKLEACIADSVGYYEIAPYRELSKTGSTYTFTVDDMKTLNAKLGSKDKKLDVMFVIRTTTADGKEYADGRKSTYEMKEADDTKPIVSVACSVINPDSFPSALASTYVQGKSRVRVKVTADGQYKATISNLTVFADGKSYMSFSLSEYEHDYNYFETEVITSRGNVIVTGGANDSRGFTGTAEQSITVSEYSKPTVVNVGSESAIVCYRSNDDGKRVGGSTSVLVKAKKSYCGFEGKNLCKLQWRRKSSSAMWDDGAHKWEDLITRTDNTDEFNGILKDSNGQNVVFDRKESYSIQLRAVDDIGEFDTKELELPTEDVALHLGAGGKQVSIGEYCDGEDYTFRSAWKAKFENGIYGTLNGNVNGTTSPQYASDVYAFAVGCPPGLTPFITGGGTTNLPTASNYEYATGFVSKRSDEILTVVLFNYYASAIAINTYYSAIGGWQGWKYIHPTTT